ncbi:MAG: hypothetical protein AAF821_11765 [Cyanobacteria bacterium P01_D01_bin.156]
MKTYQNQLHPFIYLSLGAGYLLFQGAVCWLFLPRANFLQNNLIMLPLGAVFLGWLYYFSLTSKLRVYPEGFHWRQGRVHLRSSWSNVSHLGSMNDGYATTYGLSLKTPMPTKVYPKGFLPKWLIDPKTMNYVPLSGIVVPLPTRGSTIDEHALRRTPFGQDLMRYAPQVFQNPVESEQSNHCTKQTELRSQAP